MGLGAGGDAARRARELHERGLELTESGRLPEATDVYRELVALQPDSAEAWFDLAMVSKRLRRWSESVDAGRQAAALDADDHSTWWNLGIAATGIRDWRTAREAWQRCGVALPDGDGPIEADLGIAPVRLASDDGEVVWGHRIDPARIRISNVPLPESGHRWSDVVLHDGVPQGERVWQGRTFPVFDELERWEASTVPTWALEVNAPTSADLDELGMAVTDGGWGIEDWTGSVQFICRECSLGRPHGRHSGDEPGTWRPLRRIGAAAPREVLDGFLAAWVAGGRGRSASEPEPGV